MGIYGGKDLRNLRGKELSATDWISHDVDILGKTGQIIIEFSMRNTCGFRQISYIYQRHVLLFWKKKSIRFFFIENSYHIDAY